MGKCPNCAGEMIPNLAAGIIVCPYCDTELPISGAKTGKAGNMEKRANIDAVAHLFVIQSTDFNKSGRISWRTLCETLNAGKSTEQLKEELIQLANGREEFASLSWNPVLMQRLLQKVSHLFTRNEELVIYKDSGIFSKLKEGIVITNQKMIFIKKKINRTLDFSQIRKIEKACISDSWYFNGNVDFDIDSLGCDSAELGEMLAYACMRCAELSPANHRIVVNIR